MPLIMPDSTGRAAQLWLWCGMLKCMGFIALLTWALYTKTPRECLYYMEWGCMVVAVGIGFFTMASTYCVMLDMPEGAAPENFVRDWIITGVFVCFLGYLCVSGFPRRAGKSLLQRMPGLGGDAGSYEHQSLAATIAIMIGADTGFRKIMESAMGDFYAGEMRGEGKTPPRPCGRPQFSSCKICPDRLGTNARKLKTNLAFGFSLARIAVSMEDVAWDEFEKNYPDPNCFKKAKKVQFKEVDFFISHSWSDDPQAKWDAVQVRV
eukprot:COSAG06_NODE_362_length_16812_cov_106.557710_13_plen_264_part_00